MTAAQNKMMIVPVQRRHSENGFSSVIMKSFNSEHSTNSDRSGSSSIDDHIPSVIMKSFNFN
jgi:hypothetical protein